MTGTGRSQNSNVGTKMILGLNLKLYWYVHVEMFRRSLEIIGLYAEKTASVSSFNVEN